jgi:hypothetical protein
MTDNAAVIKRKRAAICKKDAGDLVPPQEDNPVIPTPSDLIEMARSVESCSSGYTNRSHLISSSFRRCGSAEGSIFDACNSVEAQQASAFSTQGSTMMPWQRTAPVNNRFHPYCPQRSRQMNEFSPSSSFSRASALRDELNRIANDVLADESSMTTSTSTTPTFGASSSMVNGTVASSLSSLGPFMSSGYGYTSNVGRRASAPPFYGSSMRNDTVASTSPTFGASVSVMPATNPTNRSSFVLPQDNVNKVNEPICKPQIITSVDTRFYCQEVQEPGGTSRHLQNDSRTQEDKDDEGPTDWAQKFAGMRDWARDFMAECHRADVLKTAALENVEPRGNENEDVISDKKEKIGLADVSDDGIINMYRGL